MNFYNDNDPKAVAWLESLVEAKCIPAGHVSNKSIEDINGDELSGYTQAHWFSGIGGWPQALKLVGWPDDVPCWSASLPCQPFSSAGKQKGTKDERHLWPEFYRLVKECQPKIIFGEQVASSEVVGSSTEADFVVAVQKGDYARANKLAKRLVATPAFSYTRKWIDGIQADLEAAGYAFGFAVLGAHSVGAPHIRQRLYWVAYSPSERRDGTAAAGEPAGRSELETGSRLGISDSPGREQGQLTTETAGYRSTVESTSSPSYGLGNTVIKGLEGYSEHEHRRNESRREHTEERRPAAEAGSPGGLVHAPHSREIRHGQCDEHVHRPPDPWSNYELIKCRDGKTRRTESGICPLAYGLPSGMVPGSDPSVEEVKATSEARIMRLHGYGNSIVPQVAAEFITAVMTVI